MEKEFNPNNIIYGDKGVLFIPDLDVQRPLYSKLPKNAKNGQSIVDADNSAYYKKNTYCDYIGDHASQGFDKIKQCTISTFAFIQTRKDTQAYSCIAIMIGTRKKDGHIYTPYGVRMENVKWADLVCFCCNDETGDSITMVYLKKSFHLNYPLFYNKEA